MDNDNFTVQKPENARLQQLVDYYFFIDIPVADLKLKKEYVMPFPRITFGYFFDHPFKVTNHTQGKSATAEMVISKISTDRISVEPLTKKVKIIGTHVKPFALSFFTDVPISTLPWIIHTETLFKRYAAQFKENADKCGTPQALFEAVEKVFLSSLQEKENPLITAVVNGIDAESGRITVQKIADRHNVSTRTIRNHFYRNVGCSPKDYLHLVRLKQAVFNMKNSDESLTALSYDQAFSDQAHFTHTVKNITGFPPKNIKKNIPDFRFLQF